MVRHSFCDKYHKSQTIFIVRHSIVEPGSVFGGKRQQRYIINPAIIPMKQCIHHKGEFHIHDRLNCMLHMSVLVLWSNTIKLWDWLFFHSFWKNICLKNSIITMIMMHICSNLLPYPLLETLFTHGGLIWYKRNLVLCLNNTSSSIIEDIASIRAAIRSFPVKTRRQRTRCFYNKLVSGHKISGPVLVSRQNTLLLGDRLMS